MIKTAILGGDTDDGGELIRVLAMHPDVMLIGVQAPGLDGTKISDRHHGLIGETSLNFTSEIDPGAIDMLFICSDAVTGRDIAMMRESNPEQKIVLFHALKDASAPEEEIVYGLPEINRKQLVRGASTAVVPESFASMALVALFPFANHLLLSGDIDIHVKAPQSVIDETDMPKVKREVKSILSEVQKSFSSDVRFTVEPGRTRRSALMDIEFDCPLNLQQMLDLYEIYDDHNFTFVTTAPIGVSEVAGTNKCIISIARTPEGRAMLTVAADCRLRGAAGEAVHIMNLLFGLHEKTGLRLKAGDFEAIT